MELLELANILAETYQNANGDKVAMMHLFGIRYANEIHKSGCRIEDIVTTVNRHHEQLLPDSYSTEIRKGIKLSEYVIEKQKIINFIIG